MMQLRVQKGSCHDGLALLLYPVTNAEPNERVNSLRISQELSRLAPSERDWGQTRVETNAERELRSVENHEMQN